MEDLERWTRVLPLGTGAFGEVHLAWDHVDGRWVALKRFTGQDELGLLRFVIESRIRVSHPHLVRTLAFRLVDDRAWLVTELARGGSLRGLMSTQGALPSGWVTEVVDQVLQALEALHATGVVHRDLKPANLLLRSHGVDRPHLLVGDFGIATWRTVSMTGIGAAIGTPGYLAPEYLDGRQPSPATDLFAVGVLAAELLSGRRLVHYSNASPAMPSSWTHTVPLPPELPAPLAAVLTRMADPDPTRRYPDCTEAREALLRAAPPDTRGDLTTVPMPDLLASVPPGWTAEGPERVHAAPPIDGGPTALVASTPHFEDPLATPPRGTPTQAPTPAPHPAPAPPPRKPVRPKRRLRQATLLTVALLLAAAAGTLWWAASRHEVPGTGRASAELPTGLPEPSGWEPEVVEPCSTVDISRERADGTERCQRTRATGTPQSWVKAPPGGFPAKSDPGGPFTFESCGTEGDFEYSPLGDHLYCSGTAWTLVH